jgi:hypothetical protein
MGTAIEQKELLWCLLCGERFTAEDIVSGSYEPETGICRKCYVKMCKDEQTCFGKEEFYDQATLECGQYCPDRKICPSFIKLTLPKG